MTHPTHSDAPQDRAVLVHGPDAAWRQRLRAALRQTDVVVLSSSREAEAAKCLSDVRLRFVLAIDSPAMRRTVSTMRPELPVTWMTGGPDDVRVALDAVTRRL